MIANYLLETMAEDQDGRMVYYSSLHAPGMKVLLPYGFSSESVPKGPMEDLADAGIDAIFSYR